MRTLRSHFFTFVIIFFNYYAFSQNTGSPYSLNELGEINFLGNVSNISMGGVDSLIDSLEFNINNPSSLAKLQLTNYHVGTFYKSSSISNNLTTDKFNSANINYIAIGIVLVFCNRHNPVRCILCSPVGWRLQLLRGSRTFGIPPPMSSRQRNLEPLGRWHATICS